MIFEAVCEWQNHVEGRDPEAAFHALWQAMWDAAPVVEDELLERVAAIMRDEVHVFCRDERCTCGGDERWDCLMSTTPDELARAAIRAIQGVGK